MLNLFWTLVARIVATPWIADRLIRRAMKTPFNHLPSNDDPSYMARYWLFNPYPESSQDRKRWQFPWSIRLHHIKRPDAERDLHDHPWNARTIILRGGYIEQRLLKQDDPARAEALRRAGLPSDTKAELTEYFSRFRGQTAKINHNEYHSITSLLDDRLGVWTMFISGPWLGDWGFLRNGTKVWWRTYLKDKEEAERLTRKYEDNVRYGKFGNVKHSELVGKAMSLGPLAKLVALDEVEPGYEFGVGGRSAAEIMERAASVNPEMIPVVEIPQPDPLGPDLIPARVIEYTPASGKLNHEEANALQRVLLCPHCVNGCPHCDPDMLFNWGPAK